MADSYRSKPRKVMAKRRREADPGFRTRVIERKPNHGDGYPLNKKLINKIIDIIPDEYLFGLKSIELKPRGERFPGQPLGTYNRRTKHIIIYSYPVNRKLHYTGFEDTEKWKEVFQVWADLPSEQDFRKDAQLMESISDCALFCKVLFHEIGHHYTYNYKTRNKPARKKEHIELQAELFGPRIMMEVISGIKEIIPSPFTSDNETRFSSAIRRGTGETHFILKENPDKDFSDIILNAVLSNLSWYGLSDRDEYHYEIINLSAQKEKLKQSIIKKLRQTRSTYLADNLVSIVVLFAREGDKKALAGLYDAFKKRLKKEAGFWGYEEDIVAIDGIKGLITIAEMLGEVIFNDRKPEKHRSSYEANTEIIDFLQSEKPEINVIEELEKLSETNAYIRTFLTTYKNRLKNKKEERSLNPKNQTTESILDYDTLKKKIKSRKFFTIPSDESIRNIHEKDIIKLADELIKEKDIELLKGYLRVFSMIKFPYDYKYILDILKDADNKNTISEYAVKALAYFKSKELRDFALEQIAKAEVPNLFFGLLTYNYKEGDGQLLTDMIENSHSENQLENMMHDIKAIYRKNKTAECLYPLLAAYNKHNCDMCREDIIAIMYENQVLPKKILKEMQYDSSLEIREMYEEIKNK